MRSVWRRVGGGHSVGWCPAVCSGLAARGAVAETEAEGERQEKRRIVFGALAVLALSACGSGGGADSRPSTGMGTASVRFMEEAMVEFERLCTLADAAWFEFRAGQRSFEDTARVFLDRHYADTSVGSHSGNGWGPLWNLHERLYSINDGSREGIGPYRRQLYGLVDAELLNNRFGTYVDETRTCNLRNCAVRGLKGRPLEDPHWEAFEAERQRIRTDYEAFKQAWESR